MKFVFLAITCNLIISCCSQNKSENTGISNSKSPTFVELNKDTIPVSDSLERQLSDKKVKITVSYAAISCGCPQWFESKFKDVQFLEGVERFYLEPLNRQLKNANDLWDGKHLPLTVKITGWFSVKEELPVTYQTKGVPEKAKVFWYDKITVISQPTNKTAN